MSAKILDGMTRQQRHRKLYPATVEQKAARRADYHARAKWVLIKRRYGITQQEYEALLVSQCGLCAICGQGKKLEIDHHHASGKVRSLLCHVCNKVIGLVEEDPDRLRAMVRYVS